MNNQPKKEKYISEAVFKREMKGLDSTVAQLDIKIDSSVARLDAKTDRLEQKIDGVALALVQTTARFEKRFDQLEETMTSNTNLILDRIDHLSKKATVVDQEQGVQAFHLVEVRRTVEDHEKRLVRLETDK